MSKHLGDLSLREFEALIRIIAGWLVEVPDDERITPELKALRTYLNMYFQHISADTLRNRELYRQYRAGVLSQEPGLEWYLDPSLYAAPFE